jgi:oxalyl-CoA decarboxylase
MTHGFQLAVDALKLNGVKTIFGVAGIPITDLARLAQAEGIRYIGFRHEQSAGNAAAITGYDEEARGLPHGISSRFFKWHDHARERDHQRLPNDPDQRIEQPGDHRS